MRGSRDEGGALGGEAMACGRRVLGSLRKGNSASWHKSGVKMGGWPGTPIKEEVVVARGVCVCVCVCVC